MSDAYERERQNNSRLDELASKVSALRGVTIDIYSNARDHATIESSSNVFDNMGTSLRSTSSRLSRMAGQGSRLGTLKLAAIIVGVVIALWFVLGWFR